MSTLKVDTILKRTGTGTITLGQSGDTISIPSGATLNSAGTNTLTGVSMTSQIGTEVINIGVPVTGSTATMTAGQSTIDPTYLIGEGWGRDTYGNLGWGVNYSVIGGGVNGIPMSASIGNEDAFTDFTVEVTFSGALQTAITPVGTIANSDTEIAHSFHIQGSIGTLTFVGHANVPVTGNSTSVTMDDTIRQSISVQGTGGITRTTV